MKSLLLILCAAILLPASCAWFSRPSGPPVRTVSRVDLPRYMGTWYEISRYPNRFQEGCFGTSATYTLLPDGRVEVVNRCRDGSLDGKERLVRGKAKVVDRETRARLKVTFFWPFSGDYWILGLGGKYEFAVVGSPNRKYLWILSRTPSLPADLYRRATEIAAGQGFDTDRLIRTVHAR